MADKARAPIPKERVHFEGQLASLRGKVRRTRGGAGAAGAAAPAPGVRPPRRGGRAVQAQIAPEPFTRADLKALLPPGMGAGTDPVMKRWRAYQWQPHQLSRTRAWLRYGVERAGWLTAAEMWRIHARETGALIPTWMQEFIDAEAAAALQQG